MNVQTVRLIDLKELAKRFGRGTRWAGLRMREMTHRRVGSEMFTTEEWLSEWMAAQAIPQTNWPPHNYDPLEEMVGNRVIHLVGELARRGIIRVSSLDATPSESAERRPPVTLAG